MLTPRVLSFKGALISSLLCLDAPGFCCPLNGQKGKHSCKLFEFDRRTWQAVNSAAARTAAEEPGLSLRTHALVSIDNARALQLL